MNTKNLDPHIDVAITSVIDDFFSWPLLPLASPAFLRYRSKSTVPPFVPRTLSISNNEAMYIDKRVGPPHLGEMRWKTKVSPTSSRGLKKRTTVGWPNGIQSESVVDSESGWGCGWMDRHHCLKQKNEVGTKSFFPSHQLPAQAVRTVANKLGSKSR